jgi:plasmid stabilization system protein ParE
VPRLVVTNGARIGLDRCRLFLRSRNRDAAKRASNAIKSQLNRLEINPAIGRPFANDPDLRELVIDFGNSGYIALYRYDEVENAVVILEFRHQRETGFI